MDLERHQVRDGDTDVMRSAYRDFEPALPVTEEGLLAGAIGFFLVWGGILLSVGFLRSLRRRPARGSLKGNALSR